MDTGNINHFSEALWNGKDRAAGEKQNEEMVENFIRAVRRDNVRCLLVAEHCQRVNRVIPLLQAHNDLLTIVGQQDL